CSPSHLYPYLFFLSFVPPPPFILNLFFFNATPTTEIYTLSLHDALPILICQPGMPDQKHLKIRITYTTAEGIYELRFVDQRNVADRKSTRLNSSHVSISYAVFCLKKKNKIHI